MKFKSVEEMVQFANDQTIIDIDGEIRNQATNLLAAQTVYEATKSIEDDAVTFVASWPIQL